MAANYLNNAENASGEQTGVGASDAYGLEYGRRVVVDGVDTGTVLPDEERCTEEHTTEDGHNRKNFTDRRPLRQWQS